VDVVDVVSNGGAGICVVVVVGLQLKEQSPKLNI
jgi:hypothetical protein